MQLPSLTTRQWFWWLVLAAFLWAYVGTRTSPGQGSSTRESSMMQKTQNVLGWPVDTLLTPTRWIFENVQGAGQWAVERLSARNMSTETAEALRQENERLKDDLL